jgi:hypothetical protein
MNMTKNETQNEKFDKQKKKLKKLNRC